jgi:hypothetical protein
MSVTQITVYNNSRFRAAVVVFAIVLGSLAIWVLAAETVRPPIIGFTTDPQSAALSYQHRDAAIAAARIGLVRGDLWSEAAFTYGNMLWSEDNTATNAERAPIEQSRAVAELAIAYAPYDARLWLVLAANYFRSEGLNERASASLKMSYYTGSNTIEIVPKRLLLALQSQALADEEFQALVRHDIRLAVIRRAELMPALIVAYSHAPGAGREFVEKTLTELDPGMLAAIRSHGQRN